MIKFRVRLVLASAAFAAVTASASAAEPAGPDGFSVSGSVRTRYELIDGQLRTGFNDNDDLISLRSTFLLEFKRGRARVGAEIYDSRVYLDGPGTPVTTGDVNAAELVQAYIAFDLGEALGSGSKLSVQGGRFVLNLGSRRLVAADEYRNTTNGYTGLKTDFAYGAWLLNAVYVLPQVRLPDDRGSLDANEIRFDRESFDLKLYGGLVRRDLEGLGALEASAIRFVERDRPDLATRDRRLMTLGLRAFRDTKPGRFDYDFEAFRQFGSISAGAAPSAATEDVSAWFVHGEAGYQWTNGWRPRLAAEFDFASGDRPGGAYGRFDTLYGMRRAELGPAGIYNSVGRTNILAPGVRLEVTPGKRSDAFVGYKSLFLASSTDAFATTGVRDVTGAAGRFAGHQAEARVRVWIVPKALRFETSFVNVFHGRFLRDAPNGPADGNTQYVSLNLSAYF